MSETSGITAESFRLNAELSDYFDDWLINGTNRDVDYILYARTAKLAEECGEVMEALIGYTGDNPRKGKHCSLADVQTELCDVILTAMCALHTITKDVATEARLVNERIAFVYNRLLGGKVAA